MTLRRFSLRWLPALFPMTFLAWLLAGCSTWQPPTTDAVTALRARAETTSKQGITLRAAVLSQADTDRMFGIDIRGTGVQPVWIEVENASERSMILLRTGTDPDYFSPLEVAWSVHSWFDRKSNARLDEWFNRQGFRNPIPAGATRSGVVFTNPSRGTKLLNVDLLGDQTLIAFTLFLSVPDDASHPDFSRKLFAYPPAAVTDYPDLGSLRAALERLPCCATDAAGQGVGEPLNGIVVGAVADFSAAMIRRNYRRNQQDFDNAQRVFGRIPDAVLRKQAQAGAPATWIRVWLAPISYQGRPVYLLQVGRPVGGRFAAADVAQLMHGDVDEARNLMVQDCMYSEGLEKLAFVRGPTPVPLAQERATFSGAHYHTDGRRAVMFFVLRPLSLSDIDILDWEPIVEGESHARE
ncbi:hypothetical protein SAMN05216321_113183 [Cupriavidus sp. OV038]|jgi:hypothetical protein|uniref:LssY C-terminal domain-containing protein n=1 Tax=unclassified Cupriavidus TaxID=2640874 RepID=UPI0008EA4E4F|nr:MULTISPECIES: LssY C-terminal domain-containing protein [unclassified Cupriavidus]SFD20462.1 hypothetical protein SAMN05216321_113183 [Cupriavidus sp. OV038]SFP86079.1 hypothetical protein SAMN05216322_1124 [Cupriavidus sp. OV096]